MSQHEILVAMTAAMALGTAMMALYAVRPAPPWQGPRDKDARGR